MGDSCSRFDYRGGVPFKFCQYLHDHRKCPRYNPDSRMNDRQVNRTVVTENTEQLRDYVPTVPQPIDNQKVGQVGQLFPNW